MSVTELSAVFEHPDCRVFPHQHLAVGISGSRPLFFCEKQFRLGYEMFSMDHYLGPSWDSSAKPCFLADLQYT